jgi:hypothetical protein
METRLVVFIVIFLSLIPLAYLWVRGINYMKDKHPDYKGLDLFDEDDDWDNSKWQGRRRDQVEGTNRIVYWIIVIGITTLVIYGFIKFIS